MVLRPPLGLSRQALPSHLHSPGHSFADFWMWFKEWKMILCVFIKNSAWLLGYVRLFLCLRVIFSLPPGWGLRREGLGGARSPLPPGQALTAWGGVGVACGPSSAFTDLHAFSLHASLVDKGGKRIGGWVSHQAGCRPGGVRLSECRQGALSLTVHLACPPTLWWSEGGENSPL